MNWRPLLGRFLRQHSLRQRYLGVALVLVVVVVASAIATERYVSATARASAFNIDSRNQIQQRSRSLRNAVWGAEYALQSFVLMPDEGYREIVGANLRNASADLAALGAQNWILANDLQSTLQRIEARLRRLDAAARELMDVRADINRLFPSAVLMDNVLSPANARFQTAVQVVLAEIEAEGEATQPRVYQLFQDTARAWSQMIAAFRLYVVRRAGLYSDTTRGLEDAGHDVALLLEMTEQQLQRLTALERSQGLDLQASETLQQLKDATAVWKRGLAEFRSQQENSHWRSDVPLILEDIQPAFAEIWNQLDRIDEQLERDAELNVSLWEQVAQRLNMNLLSLALLATVSIALGFVFFQRTVLQPLSQLTRAMKAIAKGEPHATLPRVNSVEAGDLVEAFAHMRRAVHERQVALRHQALHDTLTALPNRTLLRDRLQQAILSAERGQHAGFSLLMLDLDRFKEINDTLGHAAGDHVLCEIGVRLSSLLRRSDTVARLGGDEFAVLLPDMQLRQAQEIAQLIAETVERPLFYQDRDLPVGVSIGISVYPDHGRDSETLFKHADVAMYVAKQNGLAYSVYDVQQDQHSLGRLALISELRAAIAENALTLHYQPKLNMADGRLIGVEALLRWPKWSAIPTEYLIRTAEKTSLIKPLTQWVLQAAIRQIASWRKGGLELSVAVNLSTWNLTHSDIDVTVQELLLEHDVPAALLELEITENAMMQNPDRAHAILDRLAALGVRLTVDDYGTGFSSLAYLKNMPVDRIKIDKSFVSDMLLDENDAVIVRSTIDLAHNLGMHVVAEGVSNREIWDLLEILGCDAAQGYFIAHPMPAQALEGWLCGDMQDDTRWSGRRA